MRQDKTSQDKTRQDDITYDEYDENIQIFNNHCIVSDKIRIYASNGLFDNSKQLLEDAKKAYSLGFRVYKMRVISPDTIIDLVKSFNKKFKNKMQLIVDAVQGSAANPWATKVSVNLAKRLEK